MSDPRAGECQIPPESCTCTKVAWQYVKCVQPPQAPPKPWCTFPPRFSRLWGISTREHRSSHTYDRSGGRACVCTKPGNINTNQILEGHDPPFDSAYSRNSISSQHPSHAPPLRVLTFWFDRKAFGEASVSDNSVPGLVCCLYALFTVFFFF